MLISTIIPVFNAEKYLHRCLDSLINAQIIEVSIEIILINDGSTDNSLTICKEYEAKYNNIKVFTQNNQGPSAARNLGLDHAKGDWTTFVDSDDWVVENYFKIINESIQTYPDTDIITFGYIKSSDIKHIKNFQYQQFDKVYDHRRVIKLLENTNEEKFLLYPVNKIYSKTLKLKFLTDIRLGEDTLFNLEAFYKANSIVFIEKYIYHYYENLESVTSQKFKPNLIEDMERHFNKKLAFYQSTPELNNVIYFKDIARVNLEKTFYAFLGNSLAKKDSILIDDLKKIKNTKLIQFGLKYCNLREIISIKKRITMILFKWHCFKLLNLIYKK